MKNFVILPVFFLSVVGMTSTTSRSVDVKAAEVLAVTCDATDVLRGQVTIDYWLANGDTSLRTVLQTAKILNDEDRMLLMMIALSKNYTADQVAEVSVNRCEEIAKRYQAEIKNPPVESFVRFQVADGFHVERFRVYPMTDEMRRHFKFQEMKTSIQSHWEQFLQRFK